MPRSFEDQLLAKIDREGSVVNRGEYYTENDEFNNGIASVWNKVRPRYVDFLPRNNNLTGVTYPLSELKADKVKVDSFRSSPDFVTERSDQAVGFEYSIMEAIHEHGWLGSEASVTPTNEYDDYINGIDCVVSIPREDGSYFHFGIDTTVSLDERVIDKKINRTLRQINDGRMNQVKYFINDQTGERESLAIPRFVVASSPEVARDLQNELVENPQAVGTDIAQQEMLDELEEQATFVVEELEGKANNVNNQAMRQAYAEVLNYVRKIKNEKTLDNAHAYLSISLELIVSCLRRLKKAA